MHQLALKDLEQRTNLGAATAQAVACLGDISLRIRRVVLTEILERCLFLASWSGKHHTIARALPWKDLVARATERILDLSVNAESLKRFDTTMEAFDALDPKPTSWVEFAVLHVVGDRDLVGRYIREALDFHRVVAGKAASHLALVGDNTFRTPWLAAKLLSSDKVLAQTAAKELAEHLASTRPANRTLFEAHIFESASLWKDLESFSTAEPPVLLWHGQGKYQSLFRFLAPRFLLAPDHVLDAERVHARWQWLCLQKRALKLHSLNACLRLTHWLEHQAFPKHEELLPHLEVEAKEHRLGLETLDLEGGVAAGWKHEFLYRERLGLSPEDNRLVAGEDRGHIVPHAISGSPFALAWRNYVRSVLGIGFMYRISQHPETLIYVSENKSLAGKEDRVTEGEAAGRRLVVTFFEERADGLAHRVDPSGTSMTPQLLSIAELLQCLGCALPPDPDRPPATTELLLEEHYQDLKILRLTCTIEPEAPEQHCYSLSDEVDAEEAMALEQLPESRTKMVLVRALQRAEALPETLERAWSLSLATLQARAAPHLPAPAAGRGGGRGRRGGEGRGRARGKGRGRG